MAKLLSKVKMKCVILVKFVIGGTSADSEAGEGAARNRKGVIPKEMTLTRYSSVLTNSAMTRPAAKCTPGSLS